MIIANIVMRTNSVPIPTAARKIPNALIPFAGTSIRENSQTRMKHVRNGASFFSFFLKYCKNSYKK